MSDSVRLPDAEARERFRDEWDSNFAVSANAGSGKTTAISERLAAMAMAPGGAERLAKTAVVTFTKKAAAQIGQRARAVLIRRLGEGGGMAPLDHLERAFFGTIHSFCLLLAQTYGQTIGINLNPEVISDDTDDALWEAFLEQDAMTFSRLPAEHVAAFLRHAPLDSVFELSRQLDGEGAERLAGVNPGPCSGPDMSVLEDIRRATPKRKDPEGKVEANKRAAEEWMRVWREETGYLPIIKPNGTAADMPALYERMFAPVKSWLAKAGGVLAAELALRYRDWRFERGVQTYQDQIDAAMAVLRHAEMLERIRAEGWRIILDEAQDTDPQQFSVLVEIARPPGCPIRQWPTDPHAPGPRPGHFCMVGDGQQAIYSTRADIGNFGRHLEAFRQGRGGELLSFQVTFRAPHEVVRLLNETLPRAFGEGRPHNLGLPAGDPPRAPYLQVPYEQLLPGPKNVQGMASRLPLSLPLPAPDGVDAWMEAEVTQIAAYLQKHKPEGVGARNWGDICVIAPRNGWLLPARKCFEAAGLKVALQMRKNRNGDNPAYAWLAGLLSVVTDPDNAFEWVGVLREIFGVSDAVIAEERRGAAADGFVWGDPSVHSAPLRAALETMRGFVLRAQDEGVVLAEFIDELTEVAGLERKAWLIDPSGAVAGELERLKAHAAELSLEGAGPREFWRELVASLDNGRPAGKPTPDAINLMTSHSSKGLEWDVVIVLGLWRVPGKKDPTGLCLIKDQAGDSQIYFNTGCIPGDTKDARERERVRELVRLLYVTLTRPRKALILPWCDDFGGKKTAGSFSDLWGCDLMSIPALSPLVLPKADEDEGRITIDVVRKTEPERDSRLQPVLAMPRRVLPHQLAHAPDLSRMARHESGAEESISARWLADDAIDYGLWWHETMEFMPWCAEPRELIAYADLRLEKADALGFGERGRREWALLLAGDAWRILNDHRWTRQAELSVLAPLSGDAWMDGVMDLVMQDPEAREVWVVDWKTNRRRHNETEDQMIDRLKAEYEPQLMAYGSSLGGFFPGERVRRLLYSTVLGKWAEITG